MVDGVAIVFYHNDHPPAHFHAKFGEHDAIFEIESLQMLRAFCRFPKDVLSNSGRRRDAMPCVLPS